MNRLRYIKPPFICRFFSRDRLICNVTTPGKEIFLTFDDGPDPEVTPAVLDILRKRGAKATFFCVGARAAACPEILSRISAEGHTMGNHTYHHLHGWKIPPAAYVEDVLRCEPLFQTTLFRPPYGKFTPSQYFLLRKKYLFVLWSVLVPDYRKHVSPEDCLEVAVKYTSPGAIVVFHDSVKASEKVLYALPGFLDHFLEKGYSFRALEGSVGSGQWAVDS